MKPCNYMGLCKNSLYALFSHSLKGNQNFQENRVPLGFKFGILIMNGAIYQAVEQLPA